MLRKRISPKNITLQKLAEKITAVYLCFVVRSSLFYQSICRTKQNQCAGTVYAITKEVTTFCYTTFINAETIVAFFEQLKVHYGDFPLEIVLDNARYQHCKFVEEAAIKLNITLLFLPSYSPNLNITERLWKFTKKKILYAKYYETPQTFHSAITGFFHTINHNYNPDLKTLLTLKYQFFENENVQIYPV